MDRGRPSSRHDHGGDVYYDDYDYVRGGDNSRRYRPPSVYSRSSSFSSTYSRSPSPRRRTRSAPRAAAAPKPKRKHSSSGLKTTAGIVAGVGLATLAVHRLFPGGSKDDSTRHHDHRHQHHHHHSDHRHEPRSRDRSLDDPDRVKDRLLRRGDDIRRNRFPVHQRTTIRKTGDAVVYEDVIPARDVEALAGPRGDRAMRARGFEKITNTPRRRSLDDGRRDNHHHNHPRWEEDGHRPRQPAYIER